MPEKRRTFRKRAFMAAYVCAPEASAASFCLVRDLSSTGARIAFINGAALPGTFDLQITGRSRIYRAEVIWRRPDEAGVRFLAKTSGADLPVLSQAS